MMGTNLQHKEFVVSPAGSEVEMVPVLGQQTGVSAAGRSTRKFSSIQAIGIGSFLVLLQAIDAVLTSIGIGRYGVSVEANPLLRHFMLEFGHIQTLAVLKATAILVIIILTVVSFRLHWVQKALGAVSFIYLALAIVPWAYILFVR